MIHRAHISRRWVGVGLLAGLAGCGGSVEPVPSPSSGLEVPEAWPAIVTAAGSNWTPEEARALNAALYLVEVSLAPDDPRRSLVRSAPFEPSDMMPADGGPWPEDTEALFSVQTGSIYLERTKLAEGPALASLLAHELHHMERDRTRSVNRMQEVDRERGAHAREAEDAERMLVVLRSRPTDPVSVGVLELAQAKTRALSAMYTAKFELFRLVQALDKVEWLKQMPELYKLYEDCIRLAQEKLATDHGEEVRLLDALSRAANGTPAEDMLSKAIARARSAVDACLPLQAKVDELRARTGRR